MRILYPVLTQVPFSEDPSITWHGFVSMFQQRAQITVLQTFNFIATKPLFFCRIRPWRNRDVPLIKSLRGRIRFCTIKVKESSKANFLLISSYLVIMESASYSFACIASILLHISSRVLTTASPSTAVTGGGFLAIKLAAKSFMYMS